jgi:hypothetical protein
VDDHAAPQSPADSGNRDQFSRDRAPLRDTALKCCGRRRIFLWSAGPFCYRRNRLRRGSGRRVIDARDLDDGLPRGFLAGAIVKMWVAHRLDWAGELLGRLGEELARDVGSERRCLLVNENYHSRFSLYSNPKDSVCQNSCSDSYMKNYYFSGLIYEMVNCLVDVILK